MPSTWAPNDWIPSDPVSHTYLNNIGNSIRTWGYGLTAGSVTIQANQNHLSALGLLTFHSSGGIVQDAWTNLTMLSGFSSSTPGTPPLRVRKDIEGYVMIEGYVTRTTGSAADAVHIASGIPASMQSSLFKAVPVQIMDGTGSGSYSPGLSISGGFVGIYGVRAGWTQFWVCARYAID